MTLLFLASAWAQDVAVLDFDGVGVGFDQAAQAAQGMRDAFLEDGQYLPLSSYDIADRLAQGRPEAVKEARKLTTDARAALEQGDSARALTLLKQALTLHDSLGSAWARRPELADVHCFMGLALLAQGRRAEAVSHLVEALWLYPGYIEGRAPALSAEARSAFGEAAQELASRPPREPAAADVAGVGRQLGVDLVVVGRLDADGTLSVKMVEGGSTFSAIVERNAAEVPPYPGDPLYLDIVQELLGGAAPSASSAPTVSVSVGTSYEEEELDLDTEEEPGPPPREAPDRSRPPPRRDEEIGEITGARTAPPRASKPMNQQALLWTSAGVLLAGSTVAVAYALGSDGPAVQGVEGPARYDVVITR